MLNINLTSRSSTTVIGLLIFFVPFFVYLSPENLKQLGRSNVLEIFLSLIALLIVIFISSYSVEMLIKRLFKKKIILFPLLCFAFYLNFLYTPFLDFFHYFLFPKFGVVVPRIFIFFELCCLVIIALGAKFNVFSLRMILIFSILMLINAFIPLVSYLFENIGENPTISYEIKSMPLAQDEVFKKRNVYYIIVDQMTDIETAEQFNIATKEEVIDSLSNAGLKYIDNSQSSYDNTVDTFTSLILLDYHRKPPSPKDYDTSAVYPRILQAMETEELPLHFYLNKADSTFFWIDKYVFMFCIPSNMGTCVNLSDVSDVCIPSNMERCANLSNAFLPNNNLLTFFRSTPFPEILLNIIKNNPQQSSILIPTRDAIGPFLDYIDKNGMPKTIFFAFIHHGIPNAKIISSECEPHPVYSTRDIEAYKKSFHCALKTIQMFMEKINNEDPEAIVIFQGDHGIKPFFLGLTEEEKDKNRDKIRDELFKLPSGITEKEKYQLLGKIFNAIKAPEICFDKYGLPQTNINTMRFALNCAYGFKLPYRKNIHYQSVNLQFLGEIVERKIYE